MNSQHILLLKRNSHNLIKEYNSSIIKAAKETIPRGVRKHYTPFWAAELLTAHNNLTQAREDAEKTRDQRKAKYMKTKPESTRTSWREKTTGLNTERHTTMLWRLTKALNDRRPPLMKKEEQ